MGTNFKVVSLNIRDYNYIYYIQTQHTCTSIYSIFIPVLVYIIYSIKMYFLYMKKLIKFHG
jgi:hypothetical protein